MPEPTAPDPREPKPCPRCGAICTYDGWDHVHPTGIGIGSCAAPDTSFRDQLAGVLAEKFTSPYGARNPDWDWEKPDGPDNAYHLPVAMADRIQQAPHVVLLAEDGCNSITMPSCAALVDALMPVVDAIVAKARAKGGAEALRAMSRWTVDTGYADVAVLREFRDRADALDPS